MNPIQPSSHVVDTTHHSAESRAELDRINAAIDAQHVTVASRAVEQEQAAQALAALEVERALAVDDATAKAVEAKIKRAATADTEARNALERAQRIAAALHPRLIKAEADLAAEVVVLRNVVNEHANEVGASSVSGGGGGAVPEDDPDPVDRSGSPI